MRPGGKAPTEMVEELKTYNEFLEEERGRFMKANREIAVLLAIRIIDQGSSTDPKDEAETAQTIRGLEAALARLHKANMKATADGMLLLALVKEVRGALVVCDPDASNLALAKIADVLETLRIAL
jgi:hypothetical protein